MNKNRTTGLAIVAVLSAALLGGCEAPSLSHLFTGGDSQSQSSTPTVGKPAEDGHSNETDLSQPSLEETIASVDGVPTVTNPADLTVIVNKQRSLPADYIPSDLVEPNVPFPFTEKVEKRMMREEAAKALEELFAKAKQDGIELYAVSGYRSYRTQKSLFDTYVKTQGVEHAAAYSAVPGKSEHQTGLAMDVSGADAKTRLEEPFADTPEGKWLAAHCAEAGFIIRYLNGKEDITGYSYEPWHLRYVGKELAQEITSKGITLEETFPDGGIKQKQ